MASAVSNLIRVFISHSSSDNEFCRAFASQLRHDIGVSTHSSNRSTAPYDDSIWFDERHDLMKLDFWMDHVLNEIKNRRHFVVVLSPAAVASPWVRREIDLAAALERDDKLLTLHPVIAQPCTIPQALRNYKIIASDNGKPLSASEAADEVSADMQASATREGVRHSHILRVHSNLPRARHQDSHPASEPSITQRLSELGFQEWETGNVKFILPPVTDPIRQSDFTLGSNEPQGAEPDETPRTRHVATFSIAQHPVTVAEYAYALAATQTETPARKMRSPIAGTAQVGEDWAEQHLYQNRPVVGISWNDAVKYAKWLSRVSGLSWRLPTEDEWEKAARVDTNPNAIHHIYPWGDDFNPAFCNTREGGRQRPTSVGHYPEGASPTGVYDMAGNVWEWTSSIYTADPSQPAASEASESTGLVYRVLRGGSWYYPAHLARATYRQPLWESFFLADSGFRLVLDT